MIDIKLVHDEQDKKTIASQILWKLSDYFGIPESTQNYIDESASQIVFAAFKNQIPIGYLALKHQTASCIEVYSMGVCSEYHHQGIGRALMQAAFDYALTKHYVYITVKTLGPSDPDEGYRKTRAFYEAMEFLPLEESPHFWGMKSPCLFLVKPILYLDISS